VVSLGERERRDQLFLHEALLYEGEAGFLDGTVAFVRDAVAAREPVMVAVDSDKIEALRVALGADARPVEFVAMERAGRNPGRIISLWHDFADRFPGRAVRGIGEPIWAGRDHDALVESQQHEHLLNAAFGRGLRFWLRCPYDATALPADVLAEAARSHPLVSGGAAPAGPNPAFEPREGDELLAAPLPEAPDDARTIVVTARGLGSLREQLMHRAGTLGFDAGRRQDIALAASEIATNSIDHGNGNCLVRTWADDRRFVVEVRDAGRIVDALVGRRRPPAGMPRGRGLWLVHELADLVQVRADESGTTVRASFDLPG
jgi:anti-sigma regulatory factor (Ser/Thr protein kinase)